MTVMAEPDSATVDIKPEVSTQYPSSSSSSASSLFSHLCIQSINQSPVVVEVEATEAARFSRDWGFKF
jgi:hypothetical protein